MHAYEETDVRQTNAILMVVGESSSVNRILR